MKGLLKFHKENEDFRTLVFVPLGFGFDVKEKEKEKEIAPCFEKLVKHFKNIFNIRTLVVE